MGEQVTQLARAWAEMPHLTLVLDPTTPPPSASGQAQVPEL